MPIPFSARLRQFVPLALVLSSAAVAVAAYLQSLHYQLVSDDYAYLVNNTRLEGLRLSELWRLFTGPYNWFLEYLPLRDFSYWLDMTLFGQNFATYRLHNILLYLLCLPLVYATTLGLWRYFRPLDADGAPWAAAAVTALFALHPALVESVVWITGRKYMLPNLFSMLALWLAVHARRERGLYAPYAAAAVAAFAAVMLSKSSYVTVAPVIALLWVMFWRDIPASDRRRSQLLWPLAIVLVATVQFVIFIAVSGGAAGTTRMPFYFGVEALTRTLAVLGSLLRLAVSPENRHLFYPVLEDPYLPAMVALGVAVLAAAAVGLAMALRKRSLEGFALTAFLLLCLPYIQLIPYLGLSLVQDRYLSVAAWPVLLLLVALAWRLKPVPRTALLLVFALSWGYQTIERVRDWRSFDALIEADWRAYPGYYMLAMNKILAVQLKQGMVREATETANSITVPECRNVMIGLIEAEHAVADARVTGKPQEAMTLLSKLFSDLKHLPAQSKWDSPMNLLWDVGKSRFEYQWNLLIERFPGDESVRYNAGLWMLDVHKYKDAATHLRAATESQRLPEALREAAFRGLGFALLHSGQAAAAEAPLRAALEQLPPDFRAYCLLAEVYKQTGRAGEAARAAAECRSRVPDAEAVR